MGVVPFEGTDRTGLIAVSREAKAMGIKNVTPIKEALRICPDLVLVPQKPDLYRRAHNALLCEIETVLPIDTAKSIDELTCKLDETARKEPERIAHEIRTVIAENVGTCISASIGFAANRQLAKIACKSGKSGDGVYGNGLAIWHPEMMPVPLLKTPLEGLPGVGSGMLKRLMKIGITDTKGLYDLQPKHMRQIWNNVNGERLWYALHGFDIQAPVSKRGMFGHSRVLAPDDRTIDAAHEISRLLLTKAGRRLRREDFYAGGLWLWLSTRSGSWIGKRRLSVVNDDQAILTALESLWAQLRDENPRGVAIFKLGVTLYDLSPANERQLDLLDSDETTRQRWKSANDAVDAVNKKFSGTVVHLGDWKPPVGGNAGGKISFGRIPSAEDFW